MRKLVLSAFALAAAMLLASFTPSFRGAGEAPSVDPAATTLASPALPASPQPDAF